MEGKRTLLDKKKKEEDSEVLRRKARLWLNNLQVTLKWKLLMQMEEERENYGLKLK